MSPCLAGNFAHVWLSSVVRSFPCRGYDVGSFPDIPLPACSGPSSADEPDDGGDGDNDRDTEADRKTDDHLDVHALRFWVGRDPWGDAFGVRRSCRMDEL